MILAVSSPDSAPLSDPWTTRALDPQPSGRMATGIRTVFPDVHTP